MSELSRSEIRELALECGFQLKPQPDGTEDLNPYVYDFARALYYRSRQTKTPHFASDLPTLAVDFDGVLHSYTSGWRGASVAKDPPVEDAMRFLSEATDAFVVCIYSSRSNQPGGIEAMQEYLKHHLLEYWYTMPDIGERVFRKLRFPVDKPPAVVTLDDRAICFNGTFPELKELLKFQPWNKR